MAPGARRIHHCRGLFAWEIVVHGTSTTNGGPVANFLGHLRGMVELYKVKAHASMRDVADELTTWTDRAGNDAADGRALHNSASRQAHYCTHSSP